MQKTPDVVLTASSLASGATSALADCTLIDASRLISLTFRVKFTFGSSSTSGVTVYLYGFVTNSDSDVDTTEWMSWTITGTASTTVSLHWPSTSEIKPLAKYYKVRVKNNTTQTITTLTVTKVGMEL